MDWFKWPTFKQCIDMVGSSDQTVYEFIESIRNSEGLLHPVKLMDEFYNVFTFKTPSVEILEFINRKANESGRPLKLYFYEIMININGYGDSPFILDYINIEGNPDLVISYNYVDYGIKLSQRYKCDIITRCPYNYKFDERVSSTDVYIKHDNIIGRSITSYSRRECDIKISELIPNIKDSDSVFFFLDKSIRRLIESLQIEILPLANRTNILVACANDTSIKKNLSKKIMNSVLGNSIYSDTDFYYLGFDIADISNPYVIRGSINKLILSNDGLVKFDIILIEHCMYTLLNKNILRLYNMLNENGLIISPTYKDKIPVVYDYFNIIIENKDYMALIKKNLDEINDNKLLKDL